MFKRALIPRFSGNNAHAQNSVTRPSFGLGTRLTGAVLSQHSEAIT